MADAPIEKIPLYVKAGSIIPVVEPADHVGSGYLEKNGCDVTYRVYKGGDCSFLLYEDAGDGYGYERGEYRTTLLEAHGDVVSVVKSGTLSHREI